MMASACGAKSVLHFLVCFSVLVLYLQHVLVLGQKILVDDLELTIEMGKYDSPSDIAFTEDGTLWACNKRGILTVSRPDNDYKSPRQVLDLVNVVCENSERGLLGVAPHFDFGSANPYVYLVYTFKKHGNCNENGNNGPVTRISRFTCDARGNLDCDINSEEVFLESPSFPYDHHNAGAIKFGKDGLLYASIGDGGVASEAQNRSNLFGTIVRLTPQNTIPPGNPYSVQSGFANSVRCGQRGGKSGSSSKRCQEIFAYGLRNPFRIAMNPNKGRTEFHINDVGASIWEEVSVGGDNYVGANYGWPIREGPCKKGRKCGTSCRKDSTYVEPEHFYQHNADDEGAITGGAFVPNGVWPAKYQGKYVYADYVFGSLFVMMGKTGNSDRNACPLTSEYNVQRIVDFPGSTPSAMAFNPLDGGLYFLTRGFGGRLNRVRYVGAQNRPPQPVIKTSAMGGEVGTIITFDATASTDPDGNGLSFEWDFNGDGQVDSRKAIDSYRYNRAGIYNATLRVRDGKGGRPIVSVRIGIGEYPEAVIVVPVKGDKFFVGQRFLLTGRAIGEHIGASSKSMTWEVKQHHGSHYHPFLEPTNGNEISLQGAPSPEDFSASTNSYLEVILTVTNDFGLSTTVSRNIMPKLINVEINSRPEGKTIIIDDNEVKAPIQFVSWANHPLKLEAPGTDFVGWTDWKSRKRVVTLSKTDGDRYEAVALFGA